MNTITPINTTFKLRHTADCVCQVCKPGIPEPKLNKLQIFHEWKWRTAAFIEYKDYFWYVVYTDSDKKYYERMYVWAWNLH